MQNVRTSIGNRGYDSSVITQDHLGTNLLFQIDRVGANSEYRDVIDTLGISSIRYPGGTVTEEYFDIADPLATDADNVLDILSGANRVRTREVTPLDDYLGYVNELNSTPIVVIPTYRYFNPQNGRIVGSAEEEVRGFVRDLLRDEYGDVDEIVLEIGNEFYQQKFNWTAQEFARIQARIAGWVDDEARDMGLRGDVTILAQAGRTAADNRVLANEFDSNARAVDGVVTHFYGSNSSGDNLGIGRGVGERLRVIDSTWSPVIGDDMEIAVTEWNVGENGIDDTLINGLERNAPLLRMFGEMIGNGVDIASIWTAQTGSVAGLAPSEGQGTDLTPTGMFYQMLIDATEGKRLVDTGDFALRNGSGKTVGYTYTFEEKNETVSYFASGVNDRVALNVDLSEHRDSNTFVYATILGAAPGDDGDDYYDTAVQRHITDIDLAGNNWRLQHTLNPHELLELHIVQGEGVRIEGDAQTNISDTLKGSAWGDYFAGHGGNDRLYGAGGEDTLDGGPGHDLLMGGAHHDVLRGGALNDTLDGEAGRDLLDGGSGSDVLRGGDWHDTLQGGAGNDTLDGGLGDDILDPGTGNGVVQGGLGRDTMRFADATEGVEVWAYDREVQVGDDVVQYSGIESFEGTRFDDTFTVVMSGGSVNSAGGSDSVTLLSGSGNRIDLGGGNDVAVVVNNVNSVINGGSGADEFIFHSAGNRVNGGSGSDLIHLNARGEDVVILQAGGGSDVVYGFESGTDTLELRGLSRSDMRVTEDDGGTMVDFGAGGRVYLAGVFDLDRSQDLDFV